MTLQEKAHGSNLIGAIGGVRKGVQLLPHMPMSSPTPLVCASSLHPIKAIPFLRAVREVNMKEAYGLLFIYGRSKVSRNFCREDIFCLYVYPLKNYNTSLQATLPYKITILYSYTILLRRCPGEQTTMTTPRPIEHRD